MELWLAFFELISSIIIIHFLLKILDYLQELHNKVEYENDRKPLRIKDLKKMLGKPVWDKTHNSWMIIHTATDTLIELINHSGVLIVMNKEDLERYPLYKAKVE